uniref:(California timema) hypothetical protein n=1 Tax=Timema californicum TaxID=61474 RepID=A0A7R9P4V4_TIMCA|nr:unnamed protein product [Timema californicum]
MPCGPCCSVSLVFGLVAMIAGVVGVPFGAVVSSFLRPRLPYMDPCICGAGLLLSVPCLMGAAFYASGNFIVCMVFVFFASVSLNWTWAVVSDMSLYVVVPPRRSTAQAFQILVSHAFGDAGSPYLVGVVSTIKAHYADSVIATSSLNSTSVIAAALNSTVTTSSRNWDVEFRSLQYALFMTCIVEVIGGAFFLAAAKYVVKDKATVDLANNRFCQCSSSEDEDDPYDVTET